MLTDIADVPPQQPPGPELADPGTHHHSPFHPVAVFRRLRQDSVALFGLCLVAFFILVAVFAPLLAPYDPQVTDTSRMNEAPFWVKAGGSAKPDASKHLFGLDVAGRDILSRVIYGARTSLLVGVAVVTLAAAIGVTLGAMAGYIGGAVDAIVMRAVDILLAFPFLILAIAVISIFPRTTLFHIAMVLGLTSWPGICRLTRAQVLATRDLDYVKAAEALGASRPAILWRHVIPNCIAPVIIWFTMGIAGAIMAESSLGFLGFGVDDSLSWGTMIAKGFRNAYFPVEWWPSAFPAAALALVVLAFNLLGDGLQDAINPKLKK